MTFFSLGSCSQNPEDLIEELKDDGWTYVTTHGTKGELKERENCKVKAHKQWKLPGSREERKTKIIKKYP